MICQFLSKLFSKPQIVSRLIEDEEILVRFLFERDFKKKIVKKERIIDGGVFLDTRGVSMQREKYSNENECKKRALNNPNKFVGFLIFRKKTFNQVHSDHKKERETFEAIIKSTPLDINNRIVPENILVKVRDKGNPGHADLIYIEPVILNDETPKIAIRVFSRKLYKESKLILYTDNNYGFGEYKFKDVI